MPHLITEIHVEQLFGRYDYHIQLHDNANGGVPRMSLLYGDNGSGKTTILNLVFHLLSSSPRRGLKTRIARVPFRNFTVTLSDGTTVFASRTLDHLTGAFELGLGLRDAPPQRVKIEVEPETGRIPVRMAPSELVPLLRKIAEFVPAIFYLGDDRTLEGDPLPENDERTLSGRIIGDFEEDGLINVSRGLREPRLPALNESIRRTQQQLYVELAHASTRGEADARQIYAEILGSIASASASPDVEPQEKSALERDLRELESISREFEAFHLAPAIDAAPLSESLYKADELTLPIVAQVLRSFLDGQRARLNALDVLYKKMHKFVSITNAYLADKQIELDITKGLSIRVPSGELDPTLLSSGEQHLLLLFLNVVASSEESRFFIIDEPELSLNVKWQRQLVDSLLELTGDSECQFLLATHSIELLSKHSDCVVKLSQ